MSGPRLILLVATAGAISALGFSSGVTTWVWAYRDPTDTFDIIFSNGTGVTNNQETGFWKMVRWRVTLSWRETPHREARRPIPFAIQFRLVRVSICYKKCWIPAGSQTSA
jgi:hypothetical protein